MHLNGRGGIVVETNDIDDPVYKEAVSVVVQSGKASTSALQTRLRIGYQRAARYMSTMEQQGIIGPQDGSRPRAVLISSVDEAFGGGATESENYEAEEEI